MAGVERQWTDSQRRGIETVGGNVLVSAAAGSGKTSVLAERCAHLICDGADRCSVDELLVVTFTEAAAAEMKGRIQSALSARAARQPGDAHIAQQLALSDAADVGTLHGFCSRILRQHFHRLGIDPGFVILDAHEAAMMKLDTARDMLGEWFDREDRASQFTALVDAYGDGNDENIVQIILRLREMLASVVDPDAWTAASLQQLQEAIELPLVQSKLGQQHLKAVERELLALRDMCIEAGKSLARQRQFATYCDHLRGLCATINHWGRVLRADGIDALVEEAAVELEPIPRLSTKLEGRDAAKAQVDAVRKAMTDGAWRQGARFSQAQWKAGLVQTLPHARLLLELVEEFGHRYAAAKNEVGGLDFSDLERFTLQALLEDPTSKEIRPSAVARAYRQQFRHVLVDEYQDINQLQETILSLLSRQGEGGRRKRSPPANLFCVGDVKQSIYRFRLADPSLFRDRREKYEASDAGDVVIDLQENFRSRPSLLTAINQVFSRLMTAESAELNYDQSQQLLGGGAFPQATADDCFTGAPIELHILPQELGSSGDSEEAADADERAAAEPADRGQREAALIAERILSLVGRRGCAPMRVAERGGADASTRPLRFGDIVILLRSMQYKADTLVDSLRAAGVPVHSDSTTGYFEATEVNDVLSLLAVLDNAAQDIPLAALLRSPLAMLSAPEEALVQIRLAYPDEPFHAAVAAYIAQQTDELAGELTALWDQLARWRKSIRRRPLAEVLWSIYDESGLLAFYSGLVGGEQRVANLVELHERARQFGTFRRQGLGRFLEFLQKLQQDADLGQASVCSPAEDVVRVMSIHRSKGLEFPVVIVSDLGKRINFRDAEGTVLFDRCGGLGLSVVDLERRVRYPSLAWAVLRRQLRQQAVAEELRVLYVAMTRAKEHLMLIGTCRSNQVEKWTQRWSGHAGPIPAYTVLAANTSLDWLGPVAAAAGEDSIRITQHASAPAQTASDDGSAAAAAERLAALAAFLPLSPEPSLTPQARQTIERLGQRYPFEMMTRASATISVTKLGKPAHAAAPPGNTNTADLGALAVDELLPHRQFFVGVLPLSATDRGNATHLVLQHLDFSRAGDRSAIASQMQKMLDTRRLTQNQADAVDLDAIVWLLQQDLGQLLVEHADHLLREIPVTFAADSDETSEGDPADQPMVRGRLDVLVLVGDELAIVDYKTDRVAGDALLRRVDDYRGQLKLYRQAIERISGKRVSRAALVFLHARAVHEV